MKVHDLILDGFGPNRDQRAVRGWMIFCPACGNEHIFGTYSWIFNNDYERPTFHGSILVKGPRRRSRSDEEDKYYQCHSFVRDGNIEFLSDCTHELTGQTVPLEDW